VSGVISSFPPGPLIWSIVIVSDDSKQSFSAMMGVPGAPLFSPFPRLQPWECPFLSSVFPLRMYDRSPAPFGNGSVHHDALWIIFTLPHLFAAFPAPDGRLLVRLPRAPMLLQRPLLLLRKCCSPGPVADRHAGVSTSRPPGFPSLPAPKPPMRPHLDFWGDY